MRLPVGCQYGGGANLSLSLAVALLWALHPIQTQSVTYVVQRMEALAGLFLLLMLYCFIRAQERPAQGAGGTAFPGCVSSLAREPRRSWPLLR